MYEAKMDSHNSDTAVIIPENYQHYKELNLFSFMDTKEIHNGPEQNPCITDRIFGEVIQSMVNIVKIRDPYTYGHQKRVSYLCSEISKEMKLSSSQIRGIQLAALIHDIGKLVIPSEILNKPGRLNDSEFNIIKTHPSVGYEILKGIEFSWPIPQIIFQHHERINGSGYPAGLSYRNIILEARILAVADVIDAMSSDRPYRPALGINEALGEIVRNKAILYDGNVVDTCLTIFNQKGFTLR